MRLQIQISQFLLDHQLFITELMGCKLYIIAKLIRSWYNLISFNFRWKAQHCNATICTDLPYIAQGFNTNCASRPTGINNTWIQVTRYADANQEVPIITFYERPSFEGTFFTAYPGAALNQTARSAGSFYYVGPTSWQHKSSQNAVSGTCLNASAEVVQRGYGFSYQLNANIQVGWVQSGCNVTQPPTTTTLRTTTTTQRSTTQSSGFTHGLEIGPFILALFCAIRL